MIDEKDFNAWLGKKVFTYSRKSEGALKYDFHIHEARMGHDGHDYVVRGKECFNVAKHECVFEDLHSLLGFLKGNYNPDGTWKETKK